MTCRTGTYLQMPGKDHGNCNDLDCLHVCKFRACTAVTGCKILVQVSTKTSINKQEWTLDQSCRLKISAYFVVADIPSLTQLQPQHEHFYLKKFDIRQGGFATEPDTKFISFCSIQIASQEPLDYLVLQQQGLLCTSSSDQRQLKVHIIHELINCTSTTRRVNKQ